jgi:3-hydroxyacyl-[acyl-carrier-protein] dehydratase
MRWMWIDRVVEFEPLERMVAIKNVSLAEEHLHDHFAAAEDLPPRPVYPASLIIEGMAQTAGVLVGAAREFREKVILAKIVRAELDCEVFPGQSIRYEATIERLDTAGASTEGIVSRCSPEEGQWIRIGRIDLIFSHVDQSPTGIDVPEHNFVFGENLRVILAGLAAEGAGFELETSDQ